MKRNNLINAIAGSSFFKLCTSLVSFVSVPLLLHTLGTKDYAVWVTMTALVAWLNLFDFGSGYSLKNKVTEALAKNELNGLHALIAGTMQFYMLMTAGILLSFAISFLFVDIFKQYVVLSLIIYLPIILAFPLTLGHFLLQGLKKFNLFNFILLMQSILWLLIVFLFNKGIIKVSIYTLGVCYSLLFAIANWTILFHSLKTIKFSRKALFDVAHLQSSKSSLLTGSKFFLLQVSSLFLYALGNILTFNNLSLENVAQYDIVNKIYLMGMTIFNVVISVFWTEISHQKALQNQTKLFKIYRQLILIAAFFTICCVGVTFIIPLLIKYWTGNIIQVELFQLYPFLILVCIQSFAYCGAVFLNAFEKIYGQILFSIMASVLIIPLSNFLFKMDFGIGTVPTAAAILTAPTLVYVLFKSYKTIQVLHD